jgi:hypothetical protein
MPNALALLKSGTRREKKEGVIFRLLGFARTQALAGSAYNPERGAARTTGSAWAVWSKPDYNGPNTVVCGFRGAFQRQRVGPSGRAIVFGSGSDLCRIGGAPLEQILLTRIDSRGGH